MKFKELSVYLQKLEKTSSRNDMILILSDLFKAVPAAEFDHVMYLLQGRVAPLFVALEFGMADKMVLRAIARACNIDQKKVDDEFQKIGDLGEVAEKLKHESRSKSQELSVGEVFKVLEQVAKTGGAGSVEKKIDLLSNLFKDLDFLSVRFVARIPVAKLRLGFSDMTVLDSLSWMLTGNKSLRPEIERAYNIRPDLGIVGKIIKEHGIKGVKKVLPAVFTPILMARAERLSSGKEIIDKIGKCAIEPKFDGFRLQAHFDGKEVKLFTRNLEEVTFMYPDIEAGIREQINAKEVVLEGEAIAYNPDTNEYLPFQLTAQRKRKYDIAEMAKKIPLKLMVFDVLYLNGKNFIPEPYTKRREAASKIIKEGKTIYQAEEQVLGEAKEVENFFDDAISHGLEGILAKKLDGTYQAGARGWNWIKLKRSYQSKLNDTVDCVVMGYYAGRGKRTGFGLGAFLIGIYDEKQDKFMTIAKIGTGLTDDEWRTLHARAQKIKATHKPALYEVDKWLEPDVWVNPEIVVEIKADELTRSPVHTAGRTMKASKSGSAFDVDVPGYALRFPRLERFRDDKKANDCTTLREIEEMFKLQKK
ncbi:MAG: ATP-dependent DNA ligase [Candidatus Levyibacteriota bacterium]